MTDFKAELSGLTKAELLSFALVAGHDFPDNLRKDTLISKIVEIEGLAANIWMQAQEKQQPVTFHKEAEPVVAPVVATVTEGAIEHTPPVDPAELPGLDAVTLPPSVAVVLPPASTDAAELITAVSDSSLLNVESIIKDARGQINAYGSAVMSANYPEIREVLTESLTPEELACVRFVITSLPTVFM